MSVRLTDYSKIWSVVIMVCLSYLCGSCMHDAQREQVDKLNDQAYYYHYISLDSTAIFAEEALAKSSAYEAGRMEALNNIAFVELAKMYYDDAQEHLTEIISSTDNQLELFVANVQMMRLCQRTSRNRDFYTYYWAAKENAERIEDSSDELTSRQQKRYVYADSEMKIVYSAYLYYIGQMDNFGDVLHSININDEVQNDTAQLLNYLYNVGSGGFYSQETTEEISSKEFDNLIECYFIALRAGQIYWQANALQAISEHLLDRDMAPSLIANNELYIRGINDDEVEEALMAGNFAQRSLNLFIDYGDTYQIAGALRSLSDCYFQIGLVDEAIASLELSLTRDSLINQAPALTSSIFERLSINYSALDDKPMSDYYRNLYLDTQEDTRQDRELDVRAEQLYKESHQLNYILLILLLVILTLCFTLYILIKKRNRRDNQKTIKKLLEPLEKWKEQEMKIYDETEKESEEIAEAQKMANLTLEHNMQINIEQRAKVALVNSITPFINRIIVEIANIKTRSESPETQKQRYSYISELNSKINEYNDVLTDWIQLRKGELSLKIESFRLQDLFEILSKGSATFAMQNIQLEVKPTSAVVKADKALTLFMLNTIADNARKAVEHDGKVIVSANAKNDYVEIAIADTGKGMDEEQLRELFTRQSIDRKQHGFGLLNCKGIIEKYKKISQIFSVCQLTAESEKGKGTTFRFRLPHGMMRLAILLTTFFSSIAAPAADLDALNKSKIYADSAYFCNLQGRYADAIYFAKTTYNYINAYYKSVYPERKDTLLFVGQDNMAELQWVNDTLEVNYEVLLDIRNETAVAALALHDWEAYSYNNTIYTRLFRELSADSDLSKYVRNMQQVSDAKNVAIVLLVLFLIGIIVAFYFLYYRQRVVYKSIIEQIDHINEALFENVDDSVKLEKIRSLWRNGSTKGSSLAAEYAAAGGLNMVVEQIIATLEANQSNKIKNAEDREMAIDELRRINYENECLHVSNNVLDNCLSALKHETMYYPSKLQQILDSPDKNIAYLEEIAQYYEVLFSWLSMQAQTQVESSLKVDEKLKAYLKTLLFTLFEGCPPMAGYKELDDVYEEFTFLYPNLTYNEEQINTLFMPLTPNLKCLLVRQIVREIGESYNSRGCGVRAVEGSEHDSVSVVVKLSKKVGFKQTIDK